MTNNYKKHKQMYENVLQFTRKREGKSIFGQKLNITIKDTTRLSFKIFSQYLLFSCAYLFSFSFKIKIQTISYLHKKQVQTPISYFNTLQAKNSLKKNNPSHTLFNNTTKKQEHISPDLRKSKKINTYIFALKPICLIKKNYKIAFYIQ